MDAAADAAGDDRDDEKRRAEEEGRATRAETRAAEETPRACADIIVELKVIYLRSSPSSGDGGAPPGPDE